MEIKISGMSCNHCVMHVKQAISDHHGVSDLEVKIGSASFNLEDASKLEEIKASIIDAGYDVIS